MLRQCDSLCFPRFIGLAVTGRDNQDCQACAYQVLTNCFHHKNHSPK